MTHQAVRSASSKSSFLRVNHRFAVIVQYYEVKKTTECEQEVQQVHGEFNMGNKND